jgi:diguanylate cyclase (GGDEF)-like protein
MTLKPLDVLIVEDDEDDYILTRDLLQDIDHMEVDIRWETTFEGGLAALELGRYAVCLMDYQLGARDGMSLLRSVQPEALTTPIIFLTGQDDRELDMKAMQAGAADYLVKGKVTAALLERSIRYAIQRQQLLMEMHRRSLIDDLTGLLNRRGFEEQATRQLRLAGRRGIGIALLYADIDNFKQINDRWGHNEGDRALREVADLIRSSFRESDVLARLGGDEFVMIPIDATPPKELIPESRLLKKLEEYNRATDRPYQLSLSIGIAYCDPCEADTLWEIVAEADAAMYRHKLKDDVEQVTG